MSCGIGTDDGGTDMELIFIISALGLAAVILLLTPRRADAHCDTMDGPTVKDGMRALETGNVNHAIKWVFLRWRLKSGRHSP